VAGQTNPPPRGEWSDAEQGPLQGQGEPTIEGEIVPREEHSGVDVRIPGPIEPAPPRKIAVSRTTARWVLLTLIVLLALVAALLYLLVKPASKAADAADSAKSTPTATAVAATASAAPSVSASPTTAPGGASPAASDGATAGPSASAQDLASSTPNPAFSPINGTLYLPAPVDGSVETKVDVLISNVDYPYSTRFYCPTNNSTLDWNVAGYSTFTTTLGIPDNAQGATGATLTMTFSDQNGKVLSVNKTAIGQPATIHIPITGVERLVVTCNRTANNGSGYNQVALGNAAVS